MKLDGKRNGKGCIKWRNGTIIFEGDFRNGEFDGYGIFKQQDLRYAGEFKAGEMHGRGRLERLIDGIPILNVGDFRNDMLHNGTKMFKNNGTVIQKGEFVGDKVVNGYVDEYFTKPKARAVYTGMKLDGKSNGKGCIKWRNGTIVIDGVFANGRFIEGYIDEYFTKPKARLVYTGMKLDGKANGKGCIKWRNGTIIFDGVWVNDIFKEGYVNEYFSQPNKTLVYTGMKLDGKANGKGCIKWRNGTIVADGVWVNDIFKEGYVNEYFTKPNARLVYTGMKLDGKANGKGCFKFRNGTIVVDGVFANGRFKEGYIDGYFTKPNARAVYTGMIFDGKPNGKGCLKWRNGTILFDGVWANGKSMNGTMNKPTCHVEIRNGAIWKGYCEVTFYTSWVL